MAAPAPNRLAIAVFASDKGPGDAERATLMSQAGTFLARKGAQIICPVGHENACTPLLKSAQKGGADILVVGTQNLELPAALSTLPVRTCENLSEADKLVHQLAHAFLVLPGSLASATRLFQSWIVEEKGRPTVFFNRNRAFEVMRGLGVDVLSHSVPHWERRMQFADNMDDAWARLSKMTAS